MDGAELQVPIMCGDNQSANRIGASQAGLRNHRHLRLPDLWVRNLTRDGQVKIYDVRSKLNTSDLLTKVLSDQEMIKLLHLLNMK